MSRADDVDTAVLAEATDASGAVVMGRGLYDVVDAPDGWDEQMGYGAGHAASPPFVVVTARPPAASRLVEEVGLDVTFVTGGVAKGVAAARQRAERGDVVLMGGGQLIGTALREGLVHRLRLHLAPVVLGAGTPLWPAAQGTTTPGRPPPPQGFRLVRTRASTNAVHLDLEVERAGDGGASLS